MREPYTQLHVHLIWATWDRLELLEDPVRDAVYRSIEADARDMRCSIEALGGMPDHVHVLLRIPATLCIAEIVKQLKGSSSHMATHGLAIPAAFKWQGGYGAFTVSKVEVPGRRAYILNQAEHHRSGTLTEEWDATGQSDDWDD